MWNVMSRLGKPINLLDAFPTQIIEFSIPLIYRVSDIQTASDFMSLVEYKDFRLSLTVTVITKSTQRP